MHLSNCKAVFLDRDGTINEEVGYLGNLNNLSFIKRAAEGIGIINRLGYKAIVVTNQSGIARGFFKEAFVHMLHAEMKKRLLKKNAFIDQWYYCPHHPTKGINEYKKICACRKPAPGMIKAAAEEYQIDVSGSFVIGDSIRDVGLAINAGARPILLKTGFGQETLSLLDKAQRNALYYVAEDLMDACVWISENYPLKEEKDD